MELNIFNGEVAFNENIFSGSAEYSIDSGFTLPDYYPEISKILKCIVSPRVSAISAGGQTLTVDGSIGVNLIYCSPDNEIFGFEQILNFNKPFDIGADCSEALPDCTVKSEYINCRAVNERKVDIHGAIGIYLNVLKKNSANIVTDIESNDVMLKRSKIPATSPIGVGEKSLFTEEELELGQGLPSIRCILKYDAKAVNKECKIINGKAVVKGEMCVYVLYCAEHTQLPQIYRNVIPYSQIIDIAGLNEDCICSVKTEVASLEIKPRTSAIGETRSFMLTGKLNFKATACCENDLPVILDAFSVKYNADVKTKAISVEKMQKDINDVLICKKAFDNSENISSVIDLWCNPNISEASVKNGVLKISGVMQVCILALTDNQTPQYTERSLEFEYTNSSEFSGENLYAEAIVTANNISYTLTSEKSMEISAELCISAQIYVRKTISVVTDICIDENNLKAKLPNSSLIIYYADAGESLWDIAYKYNSNPEEISEINSLQEDILNTKKTLLIPIRQ